MIIKIIRKSLNNEVNFLLNLYLILEELFMFSKHFIPIFSIYLDVKFMKIMIYF